MRVRKSPPKEFTIDRSEWVAGHNRSNTFTEEFSRDINVGLSSLLNENEYACCLGFYSHACGVPWDAMYDVGGPGNLPNDIVVPLLNDEEEEIETEFAVRCMEINDDSDIPEKVREKAIKKMFKEKGVKVKFVGRYAK